VFVAALPTWALKAASRVLTAAAKVLPFTNPLDDKQVAQLTAPAYVCSADKLRDELGWTPQVDLAEAARRAAEGYRADGWL
jgi:nucleoside-diphosphate-sugar epimerase